MRLLISLRRTGGGAGAHHFLRLAREATRRAGFVGRALMGSYVIAPARGGSSARATNGSAGGGGGGGQPDAAARGGPDVKGWL